MTTEPQKFDASRYLTKLKGKDYLEVKWRLVWLRTEHPDASIETELVRLEDGYAVFKAKVGIPGGGTAMGYGSEEASDFGDYLEKAETKAIGRALGALGYGTQFAEDFEMVRADGEQALVDSPVKRTEARQQAPRAAQGQPRQVSVVAGASGGGTMNGQATPAQINAIYAIGRREYHWNDEEMDSYCRDAFGKLPADLSKKEASEFIDRLKTTTPTQ